MIYNRKNKTIDSKDDFVNEYRSLIVDFEDSIGNLEQYHKTSMEEPTKELVEDLNRLKLHHKKLKDMLTLHADQSHGKWMEIRPEARKVFQNAREAWQEKSDTLSETA